MHQVARRLAQHRHATQDPRSILSAIDIVADHDQEGPRVAELVETLQQAVQKVVAAMHVANGKEGGFGTKRLLAKIRFLLRLFAAAQNHMP
ncbi:hypothetical protein OA50_05259 [Mameliella alba]|uniref:Uncharacterized protein n=1 Tax=Mameliella alba TaxID=561184 RepID=A0A0B3RFZ6_9RHOB|nr:hypothetical protein OA50_05259 [Mameliella alba]